MPPAHATAARPPSPALARHDVTRREVRRGMITMLDALLDHVAELERRVAELERGGCGAGTTMATPKHLTDHKM